MTTPAQRLKAARIAAGFKSASDAAAHLGVAQATYAQHENDYRGYGPIAALAYAEAFNTTPEWLVFGSKKDGCTVYPFYDCMAGRFEFGGA